MVDRARAELDRERDRARSVNWSPCRRSASPAVAARRRGSGAPAPRRTRRARGTRRRPRRSAPPPAAPRRARSRDTRPRRRRTRAAPRARRATSACRRRRGPRAATRARCRGRARSRTFPRTSSCPARASSRVPLDGRAQAVLARRARRANGREDAAACRVQLLVARAARAQRELVDAVAAERRVRVAVDEARDRAAPASVELDDVAVERRAGRASARPPRSCRRRRGRTRPRSRSTAPRLGPRSGAAPARRRRELREVADQQPGGASRVVRRGRNLMPAALGRVDRLLVARVDVAHDAGARIGREHALEPLRRRRRSRRRATTMPAWIELPIPTPPPWCTLTHVAPAATLTRALRIGQSAIASEPSRIASVSRYGEATEPASRWSRPITTGALTAPLRTSSFIASPAFARSP